MKSQSSPPAGVYAPEPPAKQGHIFHRATAFLMADAHQEWVVHSRLRNVLRALAVFAVFGATIGFVVAKYVTDDSLRNATVTVREDDWTNLSQERIDVALCPCQNETFFWSEFVRYTEPLSQNYTAQVELCRTTLVPELATTPQPTLDSTPEEVSAYTGFLKKLTDNIVTFVSCSLTMQEILAAFNPDPETHIIGIGDYWANPDLLSQRQIRSRVDAFIGNKLLRFSTDFSTQLVLQQLVLQQLQSNLSAVVSTAMDSNDTAVSTAVEAAALGFELYQNVTADALNTLQNTNSDQAYVDRLLNTIKGAVSVDYQAYGDACMPLYCDYIKRKSTWSRLTEFLGLLGGLYTTFLGIGFTVWFVLDFVMPSGHHSAP